MGLGTHLERMHGEWGQLCRVWPPHCTEEGPWARLLSSTFGGVMCGTQSHQQGPLLPPIASVTEWASVRPQMWAAAACQASLVPPVNS